VLFRSWGELDFPADLEKLRVLAGTWSREHRGVAA
jgi:hypothetical protein